MEMCIRDSLVWVGALFFLTFFTSARERRAAVLTAATPADPRRYALARCAAALVGVALLCLAALALAALLYARLFGWTDWGSLALPALVLSLIHIYLHGRRGRRRGLRHSDRQAGAEGGRH